VRDALTTLPWVEPDSIQTSSEKRQARFTVKDRGKFDMDAVAGVLKAKGYSKATLLAGPTEK